MDKDKILTIDLENAKDELKDLQPIRAVILIGDEAYQIEELVADQYNEIISIIGRIFSSLYSLKTDNAAMEDDEVYITKAIEYIPCTVVITPTGLSFSLAAESL